jgi:putative addiction module component (TIGR02574 family)
MATDRASVLRDAMALPTRERAEVAAELLASLDERVDGDADAVGAAWAEELEHRARRVVSGDDPGEPWGAVRDRIRSQLAR